MKYKKEVKELINDLKASVDSSIKSFTAVDAIQQAIEANIDIFGMLGSAIPHLEKAREATLHDIKREIKWHKHLAKDIEDLLDSEEGKKEVTE